MPQTSPMNWATLSLLMVALIGMSALKMSPSSEKMMTMNTENVKNQKKWTW